MSCLSPICWRLQWHLCLHPQLRRQASSVHWHLTGSSATSAMLLMVKVRTFTSRVCRPSRQSNGFVLRSCCIYPLQSLSGGYNYDSTATRAPLDSRSSPVWCQKWVAVGCICWTPVWLVNNEHFGCLSRCAGPYLWVIRLFGQARTPTISGIPAVWRVIFFLVFDISAAKLSIACNKLRGIS